MSIKRKEEPANVLEVLKDDSLSLEQVASPTKFLSDIDENEIGSFNTDIPREEFIVLEDGRASIEVQGELVACLMTKDYEKAKELCQLVLRVEPDHKLCKEMHAAVCERMSQLEEQKNAPKWDSSSSDSSGSSSDESDSEGEGESSSDEESESDLEDIITHKMGDLEITLQK